MGLAVQLQDIWVDSSYLSLVGAAVTLVRNISESKIKSTD
jgi:hypothetical protein